MDWSLHIARARVWWDEADQETRYLAVVALSGALAIIAAAIETSTPPRVYRVRIEEP